MTTKTCLLYTSDAADDLLCVDLGGRRIHKKKKQTKKKQHTHTLNSATSRSTSAEPPNPPEWQYSIYTLYLTHATTQTSILHYRS